MTGRLLLLSDNLLKILNYELQGFFSYGVYIEKRGNNFMYCDVMLLNTFSRLEKYLD